MLVMLKKKKKKMVGKKFKIAAIGMITSLIMLTFLKNYARNG